MPGTAIPITGEVGGISETDAARLSVVARVRVDARDAIALRRVPVLRAVAPGQ